jgi:AraC-like DNA-binding protein
MAPTRPSPGSTLGPGSLRLGTYHALPTLLRECGVDPGTLLARFGLREEHLLDEDRRLGHEPSVALLSACATATGRPHFGLLLGTRVGLRSLGMVGRIAANADTVGQALKDLTGPLYLAQDSGGTPTLAVRGALATLTFELRVGDASDAAVLADLICAGMCGVLRDLCGPDWSPAGVRLARRRPAQTRPYVDVFRAPLTFNAPRCSVTFAAQWLARRIEGADALVRRVFVERARAEFAPALAPLLTDVRVAIRRAIAEQRCSRRDVAALLGIHERTLNRRLRAAATTLQALVEEVRYATACDLLRSTAGSMAQVAAAVGYRDATTFARAFRRWAGVTPRQFRTSGLGTAP